MDFTSCYEFTYATRSACEVATYFHSLAMTKCGYRLSHKNCLLAMTSKARSQYFVGKNFLATL